MDNEKSQTPINNSGSDSAIASGVTASARQSHLGNPAQYQGQPLSPNNPVPQDEDEIDLIQLWSVIWNKRKLIGMIFGAAVIISVIVSLLMTKIYKSSAVIIPISSSKSSSGLLAMASSFLPFSVGKTGESGKIMAVLHSRTLRVKVIKKLNLVPVFIKKKNAKHKMQISQSILKSMTLISTNKQLGTITISVLYKNPALAQKIASAYVVNLRHILNKKAFTVSKMNMLFLKKELAKTGKEINTVTSQVYKMQKKYGLIIPSSVAGGSVKNIITYYSIFQRGGTQFSALLVRLKTLRAKYAILEKLYQQSRYNALKNNLYVQVIDKPVVPYIPAKPNKKLIVAVSAVSSLFFAIFLVFFLEFIKNAKEKMRNA